LLPVASQIVLAVIGMYASIYALVRVRMILNKKPLPEPVVSFPSPSGEGGASKWGFEFPTVENFDAWADNEANWAAWEKFMDGPKFVRSRPCPPSARPRDVWSYDCYGVLCE